MRFSTGIVRLWFALHLLLPGIVFAAPFAYITNGFSGTVSVIDTANNTVGATVGVGSGPVGVAVNPTGTRVYVANLTSRSVSVIDTATHTVAAAVPLGGTPFAVAVNPSGTRVYVTTQSSNKVSVIDTGTNTVVATVATGSTPGAIAVNPSGTRLYVAIVGTTNNPGSTILVIDTATNAAIGNVAVGGIPQAVAVSPAGTRVYATLNAPDGLAVIDTASSSVIANIPVAGVPFGVAVNPSGSRIYVADALFDELLVIDAASNTVVAIVAVGITPLGVAVTPAGTRVYVANADSDNVSVVDTATNAVIATIAVGNGPVALGQFIGPAAFVPGPATATAIEYYHAAFNHYFVTAIADEITKLDNGTFVGWARTGEAFKVFVLGTAGTLQVCRLFSVIPGALISTHFYTANVPECASLKSNPDWVFEDNVFGLLPPAPQCPAGTRPLYRAYNNSMGGVPNHRLTAELTTLNLMVLDKGWQQEGDYGMAGCVPL